MEINKDLEEKLINFGTFGYSMNKIAIILDIPMEDLIEKFEEEDSQYTRLYNRGQDLADYVIDEKLFALARGGDLKALDKFEQRKKERG